MQLTYQLIDGILAEVFEHLSTKMNTLGIQVMTVEPDVGRSAHASETRTTSDRFILRNSRPTQIDQVWPRS